MTAQEQQTILKLLDEKYKAIESDGNNLEKWAIYDGVADTARTIFKINGKQLGRYKGKHYITSNSTEAKR